MEQRIDTRTVWFMLGILGVFSRGLVGWGPLLAGSPPMEWLPSITLAFLWGGLAAFGLYGAVYETERDQREGFTGCQWGMIAMFLIIPLVGLLFLRQGTELVRVGIDIVGAPAVGALYISLHRWER